MASAVRALWTVYDRKNDNAIVIADATSEECARAMGIAISTFYSARYEGAKNPETRWKIVCTGRTGGSVSAMEVEKVEEPTRKFSYQSLGEPLYKPPRTDGKKKRGRKKVEELDLTSMCAAEAKLRGVSYGQFVAMLRDREITAEQFFAPVLCTEKPDFVPERKRSQNGRLYTSRKKPMVCAICGKTYLGGKGSRTCGDAECKYQLSLVRKERYRNSVDMQEKICPVCGKPYRRKRTAVTCGSPYCMNKWRRTRERERSKRGKEQG